MGKKGSKRKTRWRTLSIGAPPGEEDEEEGLRNGYVKRQDNDSSMHSFDRKGQGSYKPRRTGTGSSSSGYATGGSQSHNDESSGSPSQSKVIFNEDEYMKITTPRQDILFKKGYLSKKKPWTGNASTSATPSTTESQSASHSTADGSETTEDQQLLDRDCVTGEQAPMMESRAHLGYGTFYDHASGYYYEYPVMLVGPAPVPQIDPNFLAAVPYKPVPLKPIEWINPAFVPKLNGQPYCMVHYQSGQGSENAAVVEELETPLLPVENSNGTCNESGTGSASCSESVAGEAEDQPVEANAVSETQADDQQPEEQIESYIEEQQFEEQPLENGINGSYIEPILMQPPMHVSHMVPAVPQPYMYPGHYMFGLPLVNVNGVTIQGGPMTRIMDVTSMSSACAKRRRKRKRRKQRTIAMGNTEDEEEDYSSEGDTGLSSSRLSWTACSTSITTTTNNRPLNPKCQDFQMRPAGETVNTSLSAIETSTNTMNFEEGSTTSQSSTMSTDANSVDKCSESCNGDISDESKDRKDELVNDRNFEQVGKTSPEATDLANNAKRLTNCVHKDEQGIQEAVEEQPSSDAEKSENDSSTINESRELDKENHVEKEVLVNGNMNSVSNHENVQTPSTEATSRQTSPDDERTRSRSTTPKTVLQETVEYQETNAKSSGLPKRKYNAKASKFVREPTPGPDLDGTTEPEKEKTVVQELAQSLENVNLSNNSLSKPEPSLDRCDRDEGQESNKQDQFTKEDAIETSNDDSGFESQTRLSDYPITEAVTEWLRRANSPDMFVTSTNSVDSEAEEEPDEEPPKNLQGNPMSALSAKSGVDNASLSRTTSCGEFARISNVKGQDQPESRRRSSKKRSRTKRVDGKLDNEAVSSSDSCGQQGGPARKRNPMRKQDVGEVCEFTEKDSVAGMRVASSSRMDSKRVNAKRMRKQGGKSERDSVDNNDTNINDDEGIVEDSMNVRTFEKGEIVVSEDGKLLATSTTMKMLSKTNTTKETSKKTEERSSSCEEENGSRIVILDSIEEPDVLECWEAETIEPVITPKKMLQSRGILCEGEATEEDNLEAEQVHVEYVQKYYRLARGSTTSVEEEASVELSASQSVPNKSEQTEEVLQGKIVADEKGVPIDEAFEVYESCYTGTAPYLSIDSKVPKSRILFGQESDGPIPCRAVCCNIQ